MPGPGPHSPAARESFNPGADLSNPVVVADQCRKMAEGCNREAVASDSRTGQGGHPAPAHFFGQIANVLKAAADHLEGRDPSQAGRPQPIGTPLRTDNPPPGAPLPSHPDAPKPPPYGDPSMTLPDHTTGPGQESLVPESPPNAAPNKTGDGGAGIPGHPGHTPPLKDLEAEKKDQEAADARKDTPAAAKAPAKPAAPDAGKDKDAGKPPAKK